MYGFLTSSSIHSNKLEACTVKNMEVMKLSQSVGVALDVSYTRLGVFLQLTKHEFHICNFNSPVRILNVVKCKSYRAKSSCFCNAPPTQFSNLRMRDTITLLTASAKLGSYKPVYNYQYVKYNT